MEEFQNLNLPCSKCIIRQGYSMAFTIWWNRQINGANDDILSSNACSSVKDFQK